MFQDLQNEAIFYNKFFPVNGTEKISWFPSGNPGCETSCWTPEMAGYSEFTDDEGQKCGYIYS